jgi:AcrR family transcriptional regulator
VIENIELRTKQFSKEQIIKAAAEVFASKGFDQASVEDIAKKAGVAKGSVYQYFKNRDELLIEGVRYFASQRVLVLRGLLSKYHSPVEKLRKLFEANQVMFRASPNLYFMNYSLLLSTHKGIKKEAAREFFDIYLKFIEEIITEAKAEGKVSVNNVKSFSLALILSQDVGNLLYQSSPEDFEGTEVYKELLDLIIN